ncbi:hypothetical protein PMAG_a1704 [Pseudoalteromonas mariniglutinosa NCIMB 1770]|nr:hypothetical protein [Pseudoalteromonas mariniglutinosa NCIMB 1770]
MQYLDNTQCHSKQKSPAFGYLPKLPQDAEFSVSQGLRYKAGLQAKQTIK